MMSQLYTLKHENYLTAALEDLSSDSAAFEEAALEGFSSDSISKALSTFRRPLDSVVNATKIWLKLRPEDIKYAAVEKAMKSGSLIFTDLRDVEVPCAYGQKADNDRVCSHFTWRQDVAEKFLSKELPKIIRFYQDLGKDPKRLATKVLPDFPEVIDVGMLLEADMEVIDPSSRVEHRCFGQIYPNLATFGVTMEDINTLKNRVWSKTNPKDILKQVNRLNDIVVALVKAGKDDVTDDMRNAISEHMFKIAKVVEWIAVSVHQITGLIRACNGAMEIVSHKL